MSHPSRLTSKIVTEGRDDVCFCLLLGEEASRGDSEYLSASSAVFEGQWAAGPIEPASRIFRPSNDQVGRRPKRAGARPSRDELVLHLGRCRSKSSSHGRGKHVLFQIGPSAADAAKDVRCVSHCALNARRTARTEESGSGAPQGVRTIVARKQLPENWHGRPGLDGAPNS